MLLLMLMLEIKSSQVCSPDPKLLVRKRLLVNLATKSSEKSRHYYDADADTDADADC